MHGHYVCQRFEMEALEVIINLNKLNIELRSMETGSLENEAKTQTCA